MCDAADGFCVDAGGSADDVEVVFVGEVEEEYVVGLAIDGFLDSVWLVCDECGEDAVVAHSGHDVIPVGFA